MLKSFILIRSVRTISLIIVLYNILLIKISNKLHYELSNLDWYGLFQRRFKVKRITSEKVLK